MSTNTRYTVALHILTWLAFVARKHDHFVTSERIAVSVNTNPVFIRRILGMLHKANLVIVQHGGVGGGWKLKRAPEEITLLDVYLAIEKNKLFAMHHSDPNAECPVGRWFQPALDNFYGKAEAALKDQLSQSTIADLLEETLAYPSGKPQQ